MQGKGHTKNNIGEFIRLELTGIIDQASQVKDLRLSLLFWQLFLNPSFHFFQFPGLSRAILCNDSLISKLKKIEEQEIMYQSLIEIAKRVLKASFQLLLVYKGNKNS